MAFVCHFLVGVASQVMGKNGAYVRGGLVKPSDGPVELRGSVPIRVCV